MEQENKQEIKIRSLCRKDRVTLTAMIKKLAGTLGGGGLSNLIVSDTSGVKEEKQNGEDVFKRIGSELIEKLIELFEDDVAVWFADLIEKTKEEFDAMPFNVEAQIIEQLLESKEIEDFFSHALRISNTMKGFAGRVRSGKTK